MSNSNPKPLTHSYRWMHHSSQQLISHLNTPKTKLAEKFLKAGLPILKKYKSGFIAEMEDIQCCLLIHLEDNGEVKAEVCELDENGSLKARITTSGNEASELIKSFVIDFPNAVMTTSQRRPLGLFSKSKADEITNEVIQKQTGTSVDETLGCWQGYFCLKSFENALQEETGHIYVAVP